MSESEAVDYGQDVQEDNDGWAWVEDDDEVSDKMEDGAQEGDLFTFCMCQLKVVLDFGQTNHTIGNNILSDEDRDNIHMFNLLMTGHISRCTYSQMRFAFRHKMNLDSQYIIFQWMAKLSGVQTLSVDCCKNSCIAYTTNYVYLKSCPCCGEAWCNQHGKPHRQFMYLPLIPQLQGYFQSTKMIEALSYRTAYDLAKGNISDVFNANHYQRLLCHHVMVDREKLPHRYFSDSWDIALGLCTNSYLLFRQWCKGPSGTPILLQNYNLPLNIRTHSKNLLCVGIVPGPHQPKDLGSFLMPLDNECAELAYGIQTFNTLQQVLFKMHAYIILKSGDIVAIKCFLNIKGHNSIYPCRSFKVQAVRGLGKTHYMPLHPPSQHCSKRALYRLAPLRHHKDFSDVNKRISTVKSKTKKAKIAKQTGIKGLPSLRHVRYLDYAWLSAWEWFHLFLENIIPNLVDFWTGQFKGLGTGREDFKIAPEIWQEIGMETAASVWHIPSTFVRALTNIATDRSLFTAESWGFWFIHLAPKLLEGCFAKRKYYTHMCELVEIMKVTLQFSIPLKQLDDIEARMIDWVQKYEKYAFHMVDCIVMLILCP